MIKHNIFSFSDLAGSNTEKLAYKLHNDLEESKIITLSTQPYILQPLSQTIDNFNGNLNFFLIPVHYSFPSSIFFNYFNGIKPIISEMNKILSTPTVCIYIAGGNNACDTTHNFVLTYFNRICNFVGLDEHKVKIKPVVHLSNYPNSYQETKARINEFIVKL